MGNKDKNKLNYEMGYAPKEFRKTLQGLFISQTPYSCKEKTALDWVITVEGQTTRVEIKITEAPARVIALLTLPVLNVSFEFKESNQEQQADFMKTFFKFFHKGGG